jgi:two-component system LytT family response regulator
MIKSILIDDEGHCLETLGMLLELHCPSVSVIDQCRSANVGLTAIEKWKPDLVFLDVEMPIMNGFELLKQFKDIPFSVIFTTGYDQYAIRAIKFSALDYLLKPIDPKDLIAAVQKVETRKQLPFREQLMMLLDKLNHGSSFGRVAVPTSDGLELIHADRIISCEADDNYTHFHLKDQPKITACRTLKEVQELVSPFSFFVRVHHSHLVNLNEVTRYVRGEGGYLMMSNGTSISVSRSRKDALLRFFGV